MLCINCLIYLLLFLLNANWSSTAEWTQPKLIVMSFDGFRYDYVNSTLTPNLYSLANAGVRGHMRSTFVTKTYPNHHSIATGLYQSYHGVVNNEFIDPTTYENFNVDNSSSFWWDQNNIAVPIYIANQYYNKNNVSGSSQWPGSISFYSDGRDLKNRTRVHYLEDFDPKVDWNNRTDKIISWLTDKLHPANVVFAYFQEPDSTAHNFGPFSTQVMQQVKKLDDLVGSLRKKLRLAGIAHKTNLIFLSDHGIAEVRAERLMNLRDCDPYYSGMKYDIYGVSPVFSAMPISAPYDSPKNQSLAVSVRDALNQCALKHFDNKFKVYLQEDIPKIFNYHDNIRILPLFILADEGYDMLNGDKGWKPKGYPVWGNHGYNNSLPSMRPLFLAIGPSFKTAFNHKEVFENIDLYPLMLHLLNIPIKDFPSNGSFDHIRDILNNQLYLTEEDFLMAQDSSISTTKEEYKVKWIKLFLYFGIGFCGLFLAGACFALTASFNKKSVTRGFFGNNRYDETTNITGYFRRILGQNNSNERYNNYRMFSDSRPAHLDSSFDDEDEDELYTKGHKSTGMKLTDIDWDIIGTGLDIDLASQINDNTYIKQTEREKYLKNKDSDEDECLVQDNNDCYIQLSNTIEQQTTLLFDTTTVSSDSEQYQHNTKQIENDTKKTLIEI